MAEWTSVEKGAKDDQGRYMAMVGGQWRPAARVAKNDQGQYLAMFDDAPADTGPVQIPVDPTLKAPAPTAAPPEQRLTAPGSLLGNAADKIEGAVRSAGQGNGLLAKITGAVETALHLGSALTTGSFGMAGGFLEAVGRGQAPEGLMEKRSDQYTYSPRSQQGQEQSAAWGKALEPGMAAMGHPELAGMAHLGMGTVAQDKVVQPVVKNVVQPVGRAVQEAKAAVGNAALDSAASMVNANPQKLRNAGAAIDAGLDVPLHAIGDRGAVVQGAGEALAQVPLSGSKTVSNKKTINRRLIEGINPEEPSLIARDGKGNKADAQLTPQVVNDATKRSGEGIGANMAAIDVPAAEGLGPALDKIRRGLEGETQDTRDVVGHRLGEISRAIDENGGTLPGAQLQKFDSEIGEKIRSMGVDHPLIASQLVDLQAALRDAAESRMTPEKAQETATFRQQYARAMSLIPAFKDIRMDGYIEPGKLMKLVTNDPLAKRLMAMNRGGDWQDLGAAGALVDPAGGPNLRGRLIGGAAGIGAGGVYLGTSSAALTPVGAGAALLGVNAVANAYNRGGPKVVRKLVERQRAKDAALKAAAEPEVPPEPPAASPAPTPPATPGGPDTRLTDIADLRAKTDNPTALAALDKHEAAVKKTIATEQAAAKKAADAQAIDDLISKTTDPEIKATLRAEADKLREKIPTGETTEGLPADKAPKVGKIPVGKTKEGNVEPVPAAPRPKLAEPEVTEINPERVEGGEPIPKGEATEVEPVPVGQADELLPVGEAAEVLPVGEVSEILPAGDAIDGPPPMDRVPMPPAPKPRMIERGVTTLPAAKIRKVAKDHGLGTKDMERAKAVAAALEKDESAVVAATTKGHTPAAFDAEIERINRSESVKEPWNMSREEAAKDYPGDEYDKMINRASDLGDLTYAEADRKSRVKLGGGKKLWAQTRAEIAAEGKGHTKAAVKDRVEWNKLKGSDGYAQWRINSNAKAAQRNVESTKQYTKDLLGVHKERVEEALVAGHDVPPEVLNDYPDLKAKYASQPIQAAESSPRPEPRGQDAATRAEQPRPDGAAALEKDESAVVAATTKGHTPAAFDAEIERINRSESVDTVSGLKLRQVNTSNGMRWEVQNPENVGTDKVLGNRLFESREVAEREAPRMAAEHAERVERHAAADAAEAARKAEADARRAKNAGKTLMQMRADKLLDEGQIRHDGVVKSKRKMVDDILDAGGKPSTFEEDRIKPMSRTAFNRASNAEQRAHEAKVKAGGKVTRYMVGDSEVDKIQYDYAQEKLNASQPIQAAESSPRPEPRGQDAATRAEQPRPDGAATARADKPKAAPAAEAVSKPAWSPAKTDPRTMTAGKINTELDFLDRYMSLNTDDFIQAGRGNERPSDYLKKTDPLSMRARELYDRYGALRGEMQARFGPDVPHRLPAKFGPRERAEAPKPMIQAPAAPKGLPPKPLIARKNSEILADLNKQIDERLREAAGDLDELDARTDADPKVAQALKAYDDAVKAAGDAQLARMPLAAKWAGYSATEKTKMPEAVKVRDALDAAESKLAAAETERDIRARDLRDARDAAGARVTVKSGGTSYTVANTTEALARLRDAIAKDQGFKDGKSPKPPSGRDMSTMRGAARPTTVTSSRAPKAVVQDFVADGDFENASVLAEHYGVDIKAGMDAKQKQAYQDWQDGPQPIPEPPKKETLADMIAAAPPPKVEPVQATHPDPAANMAFDEWAKHQYATNEYKDGYLRRAGGDEKRAALMATVSGGSKEMPIKDLLAQAKQRYAQHLLELPRDATISLDVYDALPPMLQTEAARHFFDIDTRLTKRTQNEVAVRMKGQEAAEAPIRQRLVDVDAEIKRLDSRDGPDTQKVKDLRLKRAKLEQELYEMRRLY